MCEISFQAVQAAFKRCDKEGSSKQMVFEPCDNEEGGMFRRLFLVWSGLHALLGLRNRF